MTTTHTLYRIVREHRYNGGAGRDELQRTEVIYCGYDRLEAIRVFHEQVTSCYDRPGSYYTKIRATSKRVTD